MKCCICGKEIKDYGNNPNGALWVNEDTKEVVVPTFNECDRCCDECNKKFVVQGRIYQLLHSHKATSPNEFKEGQIIKVVSMDLSGEPNPEDIEKRYYNRMCKILYIDSIGQLHTTLGSLALNPKVDEIEIIEK